jgi:hypothetical protein
LNKGHRRQESKYFDLIGKREKSVPFLHPVLVDFIFLAKLKTQVDFKWKLRSVSFDTITLQTGITKA